MPGGRCQGNQWFFRLRTLFPRARYCRLPYLLLEDEIASRADTLRRALPLILVTIINDIVTTARHICSRSARLIVNATKGGGERSTDFKYGHLWPCMTMKLWLHDGHVMAVLWPFIFMAIFLIGIIKLCMYCTVHIYILSMYCMYFTCVHTSTTDLDCSCCRLQVAWLDGLQVEPRSTAIFPEKRLSSSLNSYYLNHYYI